MRGILFDRLETAYGFSGTVLSWMRSFLTDRDQRVVFGGSSSATSIVKFGVPQGSVLGPLLFVLYTADIQHIAEGFNLGVHCYANDGQLYLYDRVQALPGVISTVVSCIAEIESWMNSNRLKLNSEKTQLIWLGSRHELVKISTTSINLGACTVDFLKTVNDLGVTIDCQLSMKDHVQRVCTTAYYHLRQLRSIRGLVISGLLLDSGPSLHHQQDRLLQQSPGGSRQISGGQATINFACSCPPDHAEKEVRPDLRRHPRQAPLASSRAKDPVQDWGAGLPMSPWERSILPIGDAHCSGGCLWSSIASISCSWGLGHSPH